MSAPPERCRAPRDSGLPQDGVHDSTALGAGQHSAGCRTAQRWVQDSTVPVGARQHSAGGTTARAGCRTAQRWRRTAQRWVQDSTALGAGQHSAGCRTAQRWVHDSTRCQWAQDSADVKLAARPRKRCREACRKTTTTSARPCIKPPPRAQDRPPLSPRSSCHLKEQLPSQALTLAHSAGEVAVSAPSRADGAGQGSLSELATVFGIFSECRPFRPPDTRPMTTPPWHLGSCWQPAAMMDDR
jgi:hypothetical protein